MPDRSGWERRPGFDLSGKRALVVGAESAAGRAIAEAFVGAGATVAVIAATGDDGDRNALADNPPAGGTWAYAGAWNVTDPSAVGRGMERLVAEAGAPTVLATALDAPLAAPIEATDDDAYRQTMAVVADGLYYVCRTFLRALPPDAVNPRIICVTTVFGERGVDDMSAYAMAHGAVHNLVRALAQELGARDGATANAIATGWMTDTLGRGPDEIGENRLMRFVPMRRFGSPDEIAPLAVLLASDAAGYISGQILHVDGGITTHL
jgi:NAD(P)-dependent dehydrogenase (short-subunit alcohol dehydrogenase family)